MLEVGGRRNLPACVGLYSASFFFKTLMVTSINQCRSTPCRHGKSQKDRPIPSPWNTGMPRIWKKTSVCAFLRIILLKLLPVCGAWMPISQAFSQPEQHKPVRVTPVSISSSSVYLNPPHTAVHIIHVVQQLSSPPRQPSPSLSTDIATSFFACSGNQYQRWWKGRSKVPQSLVPNHSE